MCFWPLVPDVSAAEQAKVFVGRPLEGQFCRYRQYHTCSHGHIEFELHGILPI